MIMFVLSMLALHQDVAPRWTSIGDWTGESMEIDAANLREEGPRRIVWVRSVYKTPVKGVTFDLFKFEIDCDARTAIILAARQEDNTGKVLDSVTMRGREAMDIPAEGRGQIVFKAVCT